MNIIQIFKQFPTQDKVRWGDAPRCVFAEAIKFEGIPLYA